LWLIQQVAVIGTQVAARGLLQENAPETHSGWQSTVESHVANVRQAVAQIPMMGAHVMGGQRVGSAGRILVGWSQTVQSHATCALGVAEMGVVMEAAMGVVMEAAMEVAMEAMLLMKFLLLPSNSS